MNVSTSSARPTSPECLEFRLQRRRRGSARITQTAATLLALPAIALMAGCQDGSAAGSPAPATSAPLSSSAGAAPAPPCPDAARLYAVLPDQQAGADARLTGPTCSGNWALLGVTGPAHGQTVELYQYVDGSWRHEGRDRACAAGDVPADLEAGACNAG